MVLAAGVVFHHENPSLREMAKTLGLPLQQVVSSKARLQAMGILKNGEWEVDKELLLHFFTNIVPFFWPADPDLRVYGGNTDLPLIHESIGMLRMRKDYGNLFDAIDYLRRGWITGDYREASVKNIRGFIIDYVSIESVASSRKANYKPRKKKAN